METFSITSSDDKLNMDPLTIEETKIAAETLCKPVYPFRKINRRFIDPPRRGEPRIALFSYIHAASSKRGGVDDKATASAAEKGIFGVAKIRGVFFTQKEADQRAEEIVRDIDSTNSVYTCVVGVPFPLVCEGYAEEKNEVDLSKRVEDIISDNVLTKRKSDERVINEIKERKEGLMSDVHPEKIVDDFDSYVEQRVKLAHLRHNIHEHKTKITECDTLRRKVIDHLRQKNSEHADYESAYMDKYMDARREAHIPETTDMSGFMKFIALPLDADDVDTDVACTDVITTEEEE